MSRKLIVVFWFFCVLVVGIGGLLNDTLIIKATSSESFFVVNSTEVDTETHTYLVNITFLYNHTLDPIYGETVTVQVKDRWTVGQFNTYDDYLALKNTAGTGAVWHGEIGGLRVPLFSWVPEIISQELLPSTSLPVRE
jgi:hypothetical protein